MDIGNTDDLVTRFIKDSSRHRPHVAKTLNYDTGGFPSHSNPGDGTVTDNLTSSASRFPPANGSTQIKRFTRNHGRNSMAHVHAVSIHNPGHHLFIRIDVWGRNVSLGAKYVDEGSRIASSDFLQLTHGKCTRVTDNSAFGSSKRDIDHRTLPSHPGGQSSDFFQGHIGRITDSALGGSSSQTVLNSIAFEYLELSIVHLYGDSHRDFAVSS